MSRLRERMRELEDEVRGIDVAPAADVRARGRRRGRRQVAGWTAAGAVVAVVAGVAVAWPERDADLPAARSPGLSCALDLPRSPSAVRLRLIDDGVRAEVRDATGAQLRMREFSVVNGSAGFMPGDETPFEQARLHYGPAAIGSAALLRASLHGDVVMVFRPDMAGDVVGLSLGPRFERLATPTEINRNLVVAGPPTAPEGCS